MISLDRLRNHVIAHSTRRLLSDKRGVSAVEFALILPVMVVLYLGLVEISQGLGIDRKVIMTAHTVADLAAQSPSTITDAEMSNILDATAAVMAPYSTGPLQVTVSAISIDTRGRATVDWSDTRGGTARAKGSSVTLPATLAVPGTQIIFSEVHYKYTPAVGYTITGTLTLSEQLYMSPRLNSIARAKS